MLDLPHGIPGEDVQPQRIVRNSFVSPRWCALALALTAARGSNTLSHLIKTLAVPVHCALRGDTKSNSPPIAAYCRRKTPSLPQQPQTITNAG